MTFFGFPANFHGFFGGVWVAGCIFPVPLALAENWKHLPVEWRGMGGGTRRARRRSIRFDAETAAIVRITRVLPFERSGVNALACHKGRWMKSAN